MSETVQRPAPSRSLARGLLDAPGPASEARGQLLLNDRHTSLVDAVDHLLNRGAVLVGDATLSVAGVDLVYLGLTVTLSSVETLRERGLEPIGRRGSAAGRVAANPRAASPTTAESARQELARDERGAYHPLTLPAPGREQTRFGGARSPLLSGEGTGERSSSPASPLSPVEEGPERGLARLVLTLVELLREILERQAVRRMDGGGLSEDEIERMGMALVELKAKMTELREVFGLEEADLNIDLGPLGKLM